MNKPYIKQTDSLGRVQNPITKESPYQSRVFLGMERDIRERNEYPVFYPNRQERNQKKPRLKARYGKQFIQTVITATLNGKVIPQSEIVYSLIDKSKAEKIVFTTKQIVQTRKK